MPTRPKPFLTYREQVDLLASRGMQVPSRERAEWLLREVGYYGLSQYWYRYRLVVRPGVRGDRFDPNVSFEDIAALWEFDARLRTATFGVLQYCEVWLRAALGHSLGRIDPMAHRRPELLMISDRTVYDRWIEKLDRGEAESREDFIVHHRDNRGGVVPVWVAIHLLDWGSLTHLFDFAPPNVQASIAESLDLTAPQLRSWLRSLNVVRNACAHHGRLWDRYYSLTPKLPRNDREPTFRAIADAKNSTFAMLTLLQYLSRFSVGVNPRLLPAVVSSFPRVYRLDTATMGAPSGWEALPLWSR